MNTLFKVLVAGSILTLFGATLLLAEDKAAEVSTTKQAQAAPRPQRTCPVMGGKIGPIDKALYVDVKGKRVYICCAACESAILADPDQYIKKIEKRGETVADAPSTGVKPPADQKIHD